jgi:transcriptional antiterminator NusG
MFWYVIFVKTGQEQKIVQIINKRLDNDMCISFIPLEERLFKMAGTVKKELKPLFSSYVFIESKLPNKDFCKMMNPVFHTVAARAV